MTHKCNTAVSVHAKLSNLEDLSLQLGNHNEDLNMRWRKTSKFIYLFIYLLKPYLYRVTHQSVKSAITGALWAIDIKIL